MLQPDPKLVHFDEICEDERYRVLQVSGLAASKILSILKSRSRLELRTIGCPRWAGGLVSARSNNVVETTHE